METRRLDTPEHRNVRSGLRLAGPLVLLLGVVLMVVTIADMAMATINRPPTLFWCGFIAIPLLFVGSVLCMIGFTGAAARYMAAETAPVAIDTVNEVAEGTRPGVRAVAQALAEGLHEGQGAANLSIEARLKHLEDLRKASLITDDEYRQQRQRIVSSV